MSVTQRTIRISLASLIATLVASYFGLANPMSAGIVALLSVMDTRLETIKTAFERFFSTILAFAIATVIFLIFGFTVYSFSLYLVIYIPLAYLLKIEAGIAPCSVLVTHFILAESVAWNWQLNGLLLMIIGLVFALLFNLWMPSHDSRLEKHIDEIEKQMSFVLFLLEKRLSEGTGSHERIENELKDLCDQVLSFDKLALVEYENTYFKRSMRDYYIKYAQMRKQQYQILEHILALLPNVLPDTEASKMLASIFGETAEQLDEENPGIELLESIKNLYDIFRESELPKTRKEFESRAILYYMLTDFEKFLVLKREFYEDYGRNREVENN